MLASTLPPELARAMLAPGKPDPVSLDPHGLSPTLRAFVDAYLANGMNGTAAYRFVHKNAKVSTAQTEAWRLLRIPKIRLAVEDGRREMAAKVGLTRDELLEWATDVLRADPNELTQLRTVACKGCYPGLADDERQPMMEPDIDCELCGGDGMPYRWMRDTRKLSRAAGRLFAGIKETREGLQVLMHDKVAAAALAGKIIGAFKEDNEQQGSALREFVAQIQASGAGGLTFRKPEPRS